MALIERILNDFPLTEGEVKMLLLTAPSRYKIHYIEKRHGRGKRMIAQPTAEIKILQRWAVDNYIKLLPIHEAATAYRQGLSIREHANIHARNNYLLKLDFQNFFPSITGNHFISHINSHIDISNDDAILLMKLLFRNDRDRREHTLSIGAPSSPAVSNTIMHQFDSALTEYCAAHRIVYSRYADDMALSTNRPNELKDAYIIVKQLCNEIPYPRLFLNHDKTVFTSKKHRRQLTGLILSNDGKPSLGRNKKREIRSMAHHYSTGTLHQDKISHLRGLLAFALSIEPLFVESIKRMIGENIFQQLMRG